MIKDKINSSKIRNAISMALSSAFLFTDDEIPSDALRMGDSGEKVEELQRTLRVLELYDYPEKEGVFGSGTRNAVMRFQREHNLDITGVADNVTLDEIDSALDEYYPLIHYTRVMRLKTVGEDVKSLQRLLKSMGYYASRPDGIYNANTASAVRTFQFDYGMSVDGIVNERLAVKINSVAISLRPFHEKVENERVAAEAAAKAEDIAVGESAYHTDAVKMQWSAINQLWRVGKSMRITDLESGDTIVMRRTGGLNHADVEPVTKEDTEKLKKLFGDRWSWSRKPVIINFSYITSAASICGMPHGEEDIFGNGVEGHFCMHFFESTNDDINNEIDKEHQHAIDIASHYVRKTEETKQA